MQHNIYSLGACLLEIGLWSSPAFWNEETERFEPDPELHISELLVNKDQRKKSNRIKATLLDMAAGQLPSAIRPVYVGIAVVCLMCLDRGNSGFGNEEEFMEDGVRYVEKVLPPSNLRYGC